MQLSTHTINKMAAVIDVFRPDIVNCHSLSEINPRVWPMAKRHGVRLVHTLHDFKSICTKGMMFRNGAICRKRELKCQVFPFPHYICQFSIDAVASVGSDILKRHLSEGFFKHIPESLRRVIWNPIERPSTERTRTVTAGEEVIFGFLGRIEPSKGVDVLLEACRKLPATGWKILIAGRAIGGMGPYLEMAAGLPVEFIGFTDRDQFFNRIDCLIAPPIWAEPFGRTVAEAYVRDVPAIGSQVAGIAEQIGAEQKEWLFPPGDASALAEVMIRAIENPTRYLRKTPAMEAVAAHVAPQYITESYLDLYQNVIEQSDRSQVSLE
jgi:glycogen(starch) synthase